MFVVTQFKGTVGNAFGHMMWGGRGVLYPQRSLYTPLENHGHGSGHNTKYQREREIQESSCWQCSNS